MNSDRLNEIKQQIEEAIPWRDGVLTVMQAIALVSEVEILWQEARIRNNINDGLAAELGKLRAENAELELGVETMRTRMNNAYQQRNDERAAVVAWLREHGSGAWLEHGGLSLVCLDEIADKFERGEHRRDFDVAALNAVLQKLSQEVP
jgi:hypothetical protein